MTPRFSGATARLLALGTANPEPLLSSDETASLLGEICARVPRERALLHALARRSGVDSRHVGAAERLPDGSIRAPIFAGRPADAPRNPSTGERMQAFRAVATHLATRAASEALDAADLSPARIDHLVTVTCTGFDAPGVDVLLIDELGLRPDVERTQVGFMGCHGAINGLRTVGQIAAADPGARILMVCVELCSLHLQISLDRDAAVPNALFADGAAAAVFESAPRGGIAGIAGTASRLIPDSTDAMTWTITDHGFRMTLDSRVPNLLDEWVPQWLPGALEGLGGSMEGVAHWAIHPGGPRILDSVLDGLGLPADAGAVSRDILRTHGNMSSGTVLFILGELLRRSPLGGDVAMLAFGPGLMAELALLRP